MSIIHKLVPNNARVQFLSLSALEEETDITKLKWQFFFSLPLEVQLLITLSGSGKLSKGHIFCFTQSLSNREKSCILDAGPELFPLQGKTFCAI